MSIFPSPAQFAGLPFLIPRVRRYETIKQPSPRRDTVTQIRDWFHSAKMKETHVDRGTSTLWLVNGRPAFELSIEDKKTCLIQIRPWAVKEIKRRGLINRMSHTLRVKNGGELKLIKPFIRLATNQHPTRHVKDCRQIRRQLEDKQKAKQVFRIFTYGLWIDRDAVCGKGGAS